MRSHYISPGISPVTSNIAGKSLAVHADFDKRIIIFINIFTLSLLFPLHVFFALILFKNYEILPRVSRNQLSSPVKERKESTIRMDCKPGRIWQDLRRHNCKL